MSTQDQYNKACVQKKEAQEVIDEYFKEQKTIFDKRYAEFQQGAKPFTDEELRYAAHKLCPCGHGLAYPKDCGIAHHWDCSAILKGIAEPDKKHTAQLPFAFYNILSEESPRAAGITTRGVFKPKPVEG